EHRVSTSSPTAKYLMRESDEWRARSGYVLRIPQRLRNWFWYSVPYHEAIHLTDQTRGSGEGPLSNGRSVGQRPLARYRRLGAALSCRPPKLLRLFDRAFGGRAAAPTDVGDFNHPCIHHRLGFAGCHWLLTAGTEHDRELQLCCRH